MNTLSPLTACPAERARVESRERAASTRPPRLSATSAARALIERLQRLHGPLMLHQAAAPCRQEAPLCFVRGEFPLVAHDVLLGEIDGTPFFVSHDCHRRYGLAQVRLDAVPGRAGLFSLERPTGWRFFATRHPAPQR